MADGKMTGEGLDAEYRVSTYRRPRARCLLCVALKPFLHNFWNDRYRVPICPSAQLPICPPASLLFASRRGFRHVAVKVTGRVGVFELDGGMGDAESAGQDLTQSLADSFSFGSRHVQDLDVAGKRVRLSAQAPDMNIVDFANARNFQHGIRDPFQIHSLGEALQQDVGRFRNDAERRPHDHSRNQEGDDRIDQRLAGSMNQPGSGDEGNVGKRVAQVVNEDRAQVQIAAARRQ